MNDRTVKSDIVIPMLQAMVTGIILGVAAWALAYLAQLPRPWAWGVAAWAIITALAWLVLLRFTWSVLERVLGIDINRDGVIGDPVIIDPQPITRIDLIENNGGYPSGQYLDLPIDRARMIMLALELQGGARFSHALSGPGRPISRGEYELLRNYLLQSGLLRWRSDYSPKDGVEMTARGRALVRAFALMASDLPTLITPGGNDIKAIDREVQSTHRDYRERS